MLSLSAFTLWGISALLGPDSAWPWAVREMSALCLPANVGTFFLYGVLAVRLPKLSYRRPVPLACVLLGLGAAALLAACLGCLEQLLFGLSGVLLGAGCALAFVCWELTFSTASTDDARRALLLASVFSTVPYILLAFLPSVVQVWALAAALIPACIALLMLARRFTPEPEPPRATTPDGAWRPLWSDLWGPLACTMMVGVVGPAIGSFATLEPLSVTLRTLLYQLANLAAAAALYVCWFKLKARPSIETAFLVLVPVAVVVLFLFPFWPHGYQGLALAFGCFIFSVVSILMMVYCIELARRHGAGLGAVYGLFAAGTYLAQILGGSLAGVVTASGYPKQFQMIAVVVLLLWGLSAIGLVAVERTRAQRRSAQTVPEPSGQDAPEAPTDAPAPDALAARCAALVRAHNLTPREAEVLELIGRGRDVGAIAEILCLSRNTVRTHVQRLYADLSVHTRQELIDLLEQTEAAE